MIHKYRPPKLGNDDQYPHITTICKWAFMPLAFIIATGMVETGMVRESLFPGMVSFAAAIDLMIQRGRPLTLIQNDVWGFAVTFTVITFAYPFYVLVYAFRAYMVISGKDKES